MPGEVTIYLSPTEESMKAAFVTIALLTGACIGCNDAVTTKSGADASRSSGTGEAGFAKADSRHPDPFPQTTLVAPQPLTPPDGTTLSEFPRRTKVTWEPVPGAAAYKVEVEYQEPDMQWHPNGSVAKSTVTEHEFDFVGAQPGRWRVWAEDSSGGEGPKSEWRTFRYSK